MFLILLRQTEKQRPFKLSLFRLTLLSRLIQTINPNVVHTCVSFQDEIKPTLDETEDDSAALGRVILVHEPR